MDSRPAMAIFELLDYIVNEVRERERERTASLKCRVPSQTCNIIIGLKMH